MPEQLDRFLQSLGHAAPPDDLEPPHLALWWAGKGDWGRAHELVQAHEGEPPCDWIHAHLHRREGDLSNARYWYRAAGQRPAEGDLDAEWQSIARALLSGVATPL